MDTLHHQNKNNKTINFLGTSAAYMIAWLLAGIWWGMVWPIVVLGYIFTGLFILVHWHIRGKRDKFPLRTNLRRL